MTQPNKIHTQINTRAIEHLNIKVDKIIEWMDQRAVVLHQRIKKLEKELKV
jgi:hypothetical protein